MNSPLGQLKLSASGGYLLRVEFINEQEAIVPASNSVLAESVRQLQEYFDGKLHCFELPLQPLGTDFQLKVWNTLEEIPYGKSWSYAQQAAFLGNIKSIRAVASTNGKNPLPIIIPCHRVIGSNKHLVGYGGGLWRKDWLLGHEKHPSYLYKQGAIDF